MKTQLGHQWIRDSDPGWSVGMLKKFLLVFDQFPLIWRTMKSIKTFFSATLYHEDKSYWESSKKIKTTLFPDVVVANTRRQRKQLFWFFRESVRYESWSFGAVWQLLPQHQWEVLLASWEFASIGFKRRWELEPFLRGFLRGTFPIGGLSKGRSSTKMNSQSSEDT